LLGSYTKAGGKPLVRALVTIVFGYHYAAKTRKFLSAGLVAVMRLAVLADTLVVLI